MNSVYFSPTLPVDRIKSYEVKWNKLEKRIDRSMRFSPMFPLLYVSKLFALNLSMSLKLENYLALVSFVGGLYDSISNPKTDLRFRVIVYDLIQLTYPDISKRDKSSKYSNLISLIELLKTI